MPDFNIVEFGATDRDVTKIKASPGQVEYWFDKESLEADCIVMERDDALALAKFFEIKDSELEEL